MNEDDLDTCIEDEMILDHDPCVGVCQVCGRYSSGRLCYSTPACKEAGGGEVM